MKDFLKSFVNVMVQNNMMLQVYTRAIHCRQTRPYITGSIHWLLNAVSNAMANAYTMLLWRGG